MRYIVDDFIAAAKSLSVFCKELSLEECAFLRKAAEDRFCRDGISPMWERIITPEGSLHCPGDKSVIGSIEIPPNFILFFEEEVDPSAIELNNAMDLSKVIAELFGFVFYVTNRNADFLLCWNDHEFLIGTGKAKDWVNGLPRPISR